MSRLEAPVFSLETDIIITSELNKPLLRKINMH